MKTVYRIMDNGEHRPHIIHEGSKLYLCVNGYIGDFKVQKIFKNGNISMKSEGGRYVKFESNSDDLLILPIV